MNDAELIATLRLALAPGIGPRLHAALVERFGSSQAVLQAASGQWREVPGVGPKLVGSLSQARDIDAPGEIQLCRENDIGLLVQDDAEFPGLLREIPDPPSVLFRKGELLAADALAVAVVGTRHATPYGKRQAERLAGDLARVGFTVVSGLARGVDTHAHRGALAAGGRTVAVLGSGLLNVCPLENRKLADAILERGALLTELPPRSPPQSGTFPRRNRLITGMCLGVVIVEAGQRSGALISVRHATEQGREVFAVPGPVDSRVSRGCHQLLRDGATLVESVDDVLEQLGPLAAPASSGEGKVVRHPGELALNDQERSVLDAIDTQPTPIDQVVAASGLPVHRVLATVSVLEMRRLVRRVSGQLVERI